MNKIEGYISVGDYARFLGVTTQTVYNMIRSDMVHTVKFNRNTQVGYLIDKPAGYDVWKEYQDKGVE